MRGRVLAMLVASVAALGGVARADAPREQLVIGVSQFPSSTHPYIDPEVVKTYTLAFATRPVTAFGPNWTNACLSCTELPSLANGRAKLETRADGSPGIAARVTLREGLFWGDGVPVTTRDIAYTARVGRDPASGFANSRTWGQIERVDIVDERNAVVHFDGVSVLFDRMSFLLPEHIDAASYSPAGKPGDYVRGTVFNRAPTTPGLWNGPYRLARYESGAQIVLEPNPYWTGKRPAFRRVVVRAIQNTAALQANLLSGDIDMAPGEGIGLTIDQVLALRKAQPDRFDYVFRDALAYFHIDVNLDHPFLGDVRVRRAMLMAINRQAMSDRLADGLFTLAAAWVPAKDPMSAAGLPIMPYDPVQARALLREAGWLPGVDGVCRNAAGERFSIDFRAGAGVRLTELIQQVVQDQLKAVCIETVLKNEPSRTFFGETLKHRAYGGLALYSWLFSVSYPPRQTLGADQIPSEANSWGGSNYMDWRNPRAEADLRRIETELDPAQGKAAWADLQRTYAEDLPVLPLFFRPEAHVVPKWLKGYVPTGTSDYGTLHAEDWYAQ